MNATRKKLTDYARSLQSLLSALDSDVEAEGLQQLSENANALFDSARAALAEASALERASLEPELASVLRWAALTQDASRRVHSQVGERLSDIRRVRSVLSQFDARPMGESCNIAG